MAQRSLRQRFGVSVSVQPLFRANRNELTLKLSPVSPSGAEPPHVADPAILDSAQELSCASATDPKVLAGAIAAQARSGVAVSVRAIGAKAVFEMIRAVGVARSYLSDDGHGQDLVCFPDFVEVQLDGRPEPTNALRLVVLLTPESPTNVPAKEPAV